MVLRFKSGAFYVPKQTFHASGLRYFASLSLCARARGGAFICLTTKTPQIHIRNEVGMKGLTDAVYFFSPRPDLLLVADTTTVIALLQELV